METLKHFLDILLHLQDHLFALTKEYGSWVYAILFGIIFAETGLVITPVLPGDSLVFAVGAKLAGAILQAVWAPDMQESLRLSVMSEEESRDKLASTHDEYVAAMALAESGGERVPGGSVATRGAANLYEAQERAARLWRRRLWKITIPVRIDAKLRWATAHDDYDNRGNRSIANDLNRRNPEEHYSYCACAPARARRCRPPTAAPLTRRAPRPSRPLSHLQTKRPR
jgi:hypothetical protein